MKRSRFSQEQIIGILREAEAGGKVTAMCARHHRDIPKFEIAMHDLLTRHRTQRRSDLVGIVWRLIRGQRARSLLRRSCLMILSRTSTYQRVSKALYVVPIAPCSSFQSVPSARNGAS